MSADDTLRGELAAMLHGTTGIHMRSCHGTTGIHMRGCRAEIDALMPVILADRQRAVDEALESLAERCELRARGEREWSRVAAADAFSELARHLRSGGR